MITDNARPASSPKSGSSAGKGEYFGVLSTISVDVPGYRFGSVAPYCLDRRRVIHISRIAQHCKSRHGRPPIPAELSPKQQVQALESKKPGDPPAAVADWIRLSPERYDKTGNRPNPNDGPRKRSD